MKITNQLVNENSSPTKDYINLTNLSIAQIEGLESCHNLKHLILRNNDLDVLTGLEKNRQLWRLEVSNCKIKNLEGFSKFVALGTLNLHGNEYNWTELEKIRHLHVIDLITSNNPKFEKDPHYRKHLIDSLPNVWAIDGLLVTSAERQEVTNFFEESALSAKPIRHRLPKYQFVPTDQKRRDIYGDWSTKLMSKFAVNEVRNIETDTRRLEFMAEWYEEIIKMDCSYVTKKYKLKNQIITKNFLKNLIEFRKTHSEMCNMILVLLVASLQFRIPIEFLNETLNYTNLNKINDTNDETIGLFELPRVSRIYVCNLLLSAIKIDRDQNIETGFYENLFVALRNILNDLFRELNNKSNIFDDLTDDDSNEYYVNQDFYEQFNKPQALKDNKSLLSTEIIQLFCIVPSFYDFINGSEGLIDILNLSIGDSRMYLAIESLIEDAKRQNKTKVQICEELGSFITNLLKLNARQLLNKKSKKKVKQAQNTQTKETMPENLDIHGTTAQIQNLAQPPRSAIKSASTIRSAPPATKSTRFHSPVNNANNTINDDYKRLACVDDLVIIGRKRIGKISKLDKESHADVKFDNSIILNDLSEFVHKENTLTIDLKYFEWDSIKSIWRPIKSFGEISSSFQLESDSKYFLIKPDSENLTQTRLNNSINLSILNHLENYNPDSFKSTIIDSHRSILTVNLIDKNERIDNSSDSSSNCGRPNTGKMVHFMLDFDNSSTGQLSAKTAKSLPTIQPSLSQLPPSSASKNFPGNKLTSVQNARNMPLCRPSSSVAAKRALERPRTSKPSRNSEFVDKWNEENLITERVDVKSNTQDTKSLIEIEEEEKELNEMKIIIEPIVQENILANVLVNSIEIMNQRTSRLDHDHNDPYMSCDCNKDKHDMNININMDKTNLLTGNSRSGSPILPKGPTSSTITLIQPTINNLNILNIPNKLTINNIYYQAYQNSNQQKEKKFIKLQDCTQWLNLPNQKFNSNRLYSKLTSARSYGSYLNKADFYDKQMQYFPGAKLIDTNLSRIQFLLGRKSNRANTNPKMPVLTSPSSKDHIYYRGLKPDSALKCFNLTSKKIEILSSNQN